MSLNKKILEALEASLERIQDARRKSSNPVASATLLCKEEDLTLAVAAQTATMAELDDK